MKDLGEADVILGVRVMKTPNGISLSQSHYVEKVLKKFNSFDVTPARTPYDASISLCNDEIHSTSGYVFTLGGGAISWKSAKAGLSPFSRDCKAAIGVAKNNVYNGKKRHIRIRHGVVKQLQKNGVIALDYVKSERNLADPLTKGLTRRVVLDMSRGMGLKSLNQV
ncbi:uncharacterized protein LOC141641835 [Silene latifolia]|uniref:uncharacterized protein LOC141641835 n=1 Tax=Silene latifolia TaxID=37657 RepID=UPI003D76DBC1